MQLPSVNATISFLCPSKMSSVGAGCRVGTVGTVGSALELAGSC
jgi:hypothetical protein